MSDYCQVCQRQAPTAHVTLLRNIGLLVARNFTKTEGWMCRDCARDKWLSETLLTFFLGWWGVISFFVNWVAVINNLAQAPKVFSIPSAGDAPGVRAAPNTGKVMLMVVGGLAVCFAGVIALGVYSAGARSRRIKALEGATASARTGDTLTQDVACQLAELHQLQRGYGKGGDVKCAGPLSAEADRITLEGVTSAHESAQTLCLKKGPTRWFVAGTTECAGGELSAVDPRLDLDDQEKRWQREEGDAIVAARRASLDAKLAAIETAISGDEEEALPLCSKESLAGYEKAPAYDAITLDQSLLGPKHAGRGAGWEFLTAHEVHSAFEGSYGGVSTQLDAISRLEKTKLAVIISNSKVSALPSLKGTREFDAGLFLGRAYLADLSQGRALCWSLLTFESSANLSFSTSKYASASSKESSLRLRLDTDFASRFRAAVALVLQSAWGDAEDNARKQREQVQALLGEARQQNDQAVGKPVAAKKK